MITRHTVRNQILAYLNHEISRAQLVAWAENAMMDGEFELRDVDVLADVIARLGAADVGHFELSWEDYDDFLSRLGYQVRVMAA
jgi:hypothetical protein